jgi:hypothetical protein
MPFCVDVATKPHECVYGRDEVKNPECGEIELNITY